MISATRLRVSSRTNGDSLITRETVFLETFARRATSLMVGRFSKLIVARLGAAADAGALERTAAGARRAVFLACFLAIDNPASAVLEHRYYCGYAVIAQPAVLCMPTMRRGRSHWRKSQGSEHILVL